MDSRHSPFALGWYASGNHRELYGENNTTYTLVPYGSLPALDHGGLDATFSWLPDRPASDDALAFEDLSVAPTDRLALLTKEPADYRLSLPQSFTTFLSRPEIHSRVPTCTACYLDLADRTIDVPGDPNVRPLRFMNDQQSVLFWYLYIRPNQEHAVALATSEFDDDSQGETIEDVVRLTKILFCAPTFEEFILRFWLENTIWFSLHRGRAMTEQQWAYLNALRRAKAH